MTRAITVVSWNVLADAYVRPEYYPYTGRTFLEPVARRRALVERLASLDADVLCLQEIERPLFDEATSALCEHDGRFLRKHTRLDGCAIFVRRTLGPVAHHELVYSDGTGHVALAAIVSGLGIATTHLKWQPPETPPDTRLGRNELRELLAAWVRPEHAWVVCGDLNADADSPVLATAFEHGLRDAYESLPDAYTCNSNGRRKRIDFILHSASLRATPSPLPAITDVTPLPSADEPSDHLAIGAKLE
jgi:nocturnin